jgi:hypothetical protein
MGAQLTKRAVPSSHRDQVRRHRSREPFSVGRRVCVPPCGWGHLVDSLGNRWPLQNRVIQTHLLALQRAISELADALRHGMGWAYDCCCRLLHLTSLHSSLSDAYPQGTNTGELLHGADDGSWLALDETEIAKAFDHPRVLYESQLCDVSDEVDNWRSSKLLVASFNVLAMRQT